VTEGRAPAEKGNARKSSPSDGIRDSRTGTVGLQQDIRNMILEIQHGYIHPEAILHMPATKQHKEP
jgi:hypothetical protein